MKLTPFLFLIFSTKTFSNPVVSEYHSYYKIKGSTSQDLRKELSAQGPVLNGEHFDAKVNWSINWYYQCTRNSQNDHQINRVHVKLRIDHFMPQWGNREFAEHHLKIKWDNYLKNLTTHEQGHADNGLKAAQEIEALLINTPPLPTCKILKKHLDENIYAIIKNHNQWDSNYDLITQHGKTQGASFP
ncbi:DUF922 domain-containing protein [Legionella sp. km772]|uniref:DUF922 domain-containing protein n=1 Tax=Legionella sp. km772 TaxID=2498111 RepID=UPI000F8C7BD8|nr:DUF922 domain-containing protein [Legionella sp. km772]RUR05892.1 DUF922 domain-containing protein [Legionella sp. km772]